jgi:hypothetical protein
VQVSTLASAPILQLGKPLVVTLSVLNATVLAVYPIRLIGLQDVKNHKHYGLPPVNQ